MLLAHLPAPTREFTGHGSKEVPTSSKVVQAVVPSQKPGPPPYGSQERLVYRPRRQDDYGDGGEPPVLDFVLLNWGP